LGHYLLQTVHSKRLSENGDHGSSKVVCVVQRIRLPGHEDRWTETGKAMMDVTAAME
jgi:hypothetical protein